MIPQIENSLNNEIITEKLPNKTYKIINDIQTKVILGNKTIVNGESIEIKDNAYSKLNISKISGKSTQATRSGRNLYNYKDTYQVTTGITVDDEGWITVTGDNTSGTSYIFFNYFLNKMNLKNKTQYNIITEIKNVSGAGSLKSVSYNTSQGQFNTEIAYNFGDLKNGKVYKKLALTKDEFPVDKYSYGTRTYVDFNAGQSGSITFRISVLEDTTITADNFVYEAYGASPSPEFPSEIKSVADDVNLIEEIIKGKTLDSTTGRIFDTENPWYITNYIPIEENTTYTASGLSQYNRPYYDANKQYISRTTTATAKSPTGAKYTVLTSNIEGYEKPKFQKGTVATPYSEYGKGTVTIEQRGKNLYNKNGNLNYPSTFNQNKTTLLDNGTIKTTANYSQWASAGYQLKNIIQNTDYTLSGKLVSSTGAGSSVIASVIVYGYSNNKWNGIGIGHLTKVGVFNIKFNSGTYSDFFISLNANGTIGTSYEAIFENIQLEEGLNATDYEPYFLKDYVLQVSEPLRSLPNGTKDTIEEDGIHRRVGSKIITMNDIAKANTSYSNVVYAQIAKPNNFIGYNNYNYNAVLCNKAESLKLPVGNFDNNKMIGKINTEAHKTMFWLGFPVGTTLDEMKSVLDGAVIQYELAEEVVEPFTEFEKVQNIETLNKRIIYLSTLNETKPLLEAEYYSIENVSYEKEEVSRIMGFIDDLEAVKQSAYHILGVERYSCDIYDDNYGVELEQYIGQSLEYIESTIQDTLEEALTQDDRIISVEVTDIEKIDIDCVYIKFNILCYLGEIEMEVNLNV